MFVRSKTSRGHQYLQIVENYRDEGRTRQRVITTLGRLDRLQKSGQLDALLRSAVRFSTKAALLEAYDAGKFPEAKTTRIGPALVFGRLWRETGIQAALPGTLTAESLRIDHPSVPNNPLLAESLYLTRYIEKAGSGTQAMIELCRDMGLPEPDFEQRQSSFVVTLWRDWLTRELIDRLDLNERQKLAVLHMKGSARITNQEYQDITGASRATAKRDMDDMIDKGVTMAKGSGRGRHYVLDKDRLKKGSIGS